MKNYGWVLDDKTMTSDEIVAKLLSSEKDLEEEEKMLFERKKRNLNSIADFDNCYEILKTIRNTMSQDFFDPSSIKEEHFGITQEKRDTILKYLCATDLITGLTCTQYQVDDKQPLTNLKNLRITLKGLEFLEDNKITEKSPTFTK